MKRLRSRAGAVEEMVPTKKMAAAFIALAVMAALLGTVNAAFAGDGHVRSLQTASTHDGSFRMLDT